jgi:shikimate kinase
MVVRRWRGFWHWDSGGEQKSSVARRRVRPGRQVTTVAAMARVLVTGMSGAGKTTVLDELRRRGHLTVDTDYDGWGLPDGTWDEGRMQRLLTSCSDVVVSGTVENQARFYDHFEHVVLLSAPLAVLVERVSGRTNNPYGRTPQQRAEIARYVDTVEPLLRRGATLELDGRRPATELADVVEDLVTRAP